jgi:hypothetical protein
VPVLEIHARGPVSFWREAHLHLARFRKIGFVLPRLQLGFVVSSHLR